MARSWASFLAGWAILAAAYLLFAGQFSGDEFAMSVLGGLAASLWAVALGRTAVQRFRFERGAGDATGRALAGVPGATAGVALALLKAAAAGGGGEVRSQAFTYGRVAEPQDAGRRAVAVLARSLAPDSFVLRAHEGEDRLELHVMGDTAAEDPRWAV